MKFAARGLRDVEWDEAGKEGEVYWEAYAALFCALRLFCCGVRLSFSSLLLRGRPEASCGLLSLSALGSRESPGTETIECR